jgi:hypothetical protein
VCVAEFFCPSARPGPPDRERQGTIRSSRIGTTGTFASSDCDAAAKLSAPGEYSPPHAPVDNAPPGRRRAGWIGVVMAACSSPVRRAARRAGWWPGSSSGPRSGGCTLCRACRSRRSRVGPGVIATRCVARCVRRSRLAWTPWRLSVRCSSSPGSCDARVGDRRSHEASAARGRHKGVRSSSAPRRVRSRPSTPTSRRSCRHRRRKRRSPCAPGTIVARSTERLEDRRRGRKNARLDSVGWLNDGTSYRRITIDDGELPSVSPRARRARASTAGARRQAAARRRPCRLELRSI